MARVMIHSKNLAQHFWGEAVNTACHIINRVYLRPETSKTPYEPLEVHAISFVIGRILGNLIQRAMKAYFWDIPLPVMLTEFSIKEQRL
jgi:lipoprotein signal peptidase